MRLIDADALYEQANLTAQTCNGCVDTLIAMDYVRCMTKRMPTIDPVKYLQSKGYTVTKPLQLQLYKCPYCGTLTPVKTEYCQQCFGKMDEQVQHETD